MANRPTSQQMEALVEFLEQNPGIARGLLRTQQSKLETKRKWQEFATGTNAMGGVVKDGPAWAKYWAEKKSALKKQCQQRAQSMRRTGGGIDILPEMSEIEQRLVAVMGGIAFATGSRGLAVDPFPQSELQSSPVLVDVPSTSGAATEVEAEHDYHIPLYPVEAEVEYSEQQGESSSALPTESRRAPRPSQQRRQGRRVYFLDSQVRRFEEIESRRVEAEVTNAQAQVETARNLGQIAAAVTQSGEVVAAAIRYMAERIAAALGGNQEPSHN